MKFGFWLLKYSSQFFTPRKMETSNISMNFSAKFDRRDEDKCFTTENIRACDNGMWSKCVYVDKNQQQKR